MEAVLIIIVVAIIIFAYEKYESKVKRNTAENEDDTRNSEEKSANNFVFVIVLIFVIIIFSAISGNIKDNNERKQAYDEYRSLTNKEYMTNADVQKAMWDEAKWKSEMEEKLNK